MIGLLEDRFSSLGVEGQEKFSRTFHNTSERWEVHCNLPTSAPFGPGWLPRITILGFGLQVL